MVGQKGYKFEINFYADWIQKGGILQTDGNYDGVKVEVLSTPTLHYQKWYWRVLNFITFGQLFNVKYTYTVKII